MVDFPMLWQLGKVVHTAQTIKAHRTPLPPPEWSLWVIKLTNLNTQEWFHPTILTDHILTIFSTQCRHPEWTKDQPKMNWNMNQLHRQHNCSLWQPTVKLSLLWGVHLPSFPQPEVLVGIMPTRRSSMGSPVGSQSPTYPCLWQEVHKSIFPQTEAQPGFRYSVLCRAWLVSGYIMLSLVQ